MRTNNDWLQAADENKSDVTLTAQAGNLEIEAEAPAADGKAAKPRTFKMTAYTGEAMNVGFFHPVVIDLAGFDTGNSPRPILIDHNRDLDHVLGQTDSMDVKDGKLVVTGKVFGESEPVRQVLALNDKGFKFQASVGARILSREFVAEGTKVEVNGRSFQGPINIARRAVLGEVSFVVLGADDKTSASIAAASAAERQTMEFAQWLAAMGLSIDGLTDDSKKKLKAKFDAEVAASALPPTPPAPANAPKPAQSAATVSLDQILEAERKKEERRQQIVNITARALQETPQQIDMVKALSEQAMQGDWDSQRYELEILRATRPQISRIIRSADDSITQESVEAAVCVTGGLEKPEDHFSERALEAANKRWKHGIGFQELFMFFANRNGFNGSPRNTRDMLEAAFARPDNRMIMAAGGPSYMSISGILGNTANKFLKLGFDSVEATWQAIAARRPVKDFKQITSYSLSGDMQYKEVPPGGELEHGTAGQTSYTNQAKTYGRMFAIDRRDIINDDLGALTQVPRRLGRGAATKLNDVFWTAFMGAISTLFTSGHANYLTGVTVGTNDSRLGIEGLTRAETSFLNQTDPDSLPLGSTPKILLVPNALNAVANQLMNSTEVRDTTANTYIGTTNPHAGKYQVVRSTYLANAAYTGNSAVQWFLLADPNDIAVVEVCFLNGVENPTVESADADFSVLGVQMRGFHDFGVSAQEYRGGVASKGAA